MLTRISGGSRLWFGSTAGHVWVFLAARSISCRFSVPRDKLWLPAQMGSCVLDFMGLP